MRPTCGATDTPILDFGNQDCKEGRNLGLWIAFSRLGYRGARNSILLVSFNPSSIDLIDFGCLAGLNLLKRKVPLVGKISEVLIQVY